jgi:uncharacterized protein (TIGR01777 family)
LPKRILITGATGVIGKYIVEALKMRGDEALILTTNTESAKKVFPGLKGITGWKDMSSLKNEKIDGIINLAGMNLGEKRWNDKVKKEIYHSRIDSTGKVVELIASMDVKPKVLVSASGVDYYGDKGSVNVYEDTPPADSFAGRLCVDWENEAIKAGKYGVRTVVIRTGFVIAKNSPAVDKLALPFKLFIGGTIGSGKQYISWIHADDLVEIYLFALDNGEVKDAVNGTAPNPETMKIFCKHLAKALNRPGIFPVPGFAVKIIAGEMAELILTGRKALPKKIIELGYKFKYLNSLDAFKSIFE